MKNKHLIDSMDFSKSELEEIFNLAHQIISNQREYSHICDGKILATLFYEPSTRTRFSFEAAMMKLGGKILGFSEPNSSSTAKGETLADTITMVSIYSFVTTNCATVPTKVSPTTGMPLVATCSTVFAKST